MPGMGIDADNIAELIQRTGAREYHVLAEKRVGSSMEYRNEQVFMGTDPEQDEFEISVTDAVAMRAVCSAAGIDER